MIRRSDSLAIGLGVAGLVAAALVGLTGAAVLVGGLYGLAIGMHGGPLVAGLMLVFGAALIVLTIHLGRIWWRSEVRSDPVPSDATSESDTVRSPPCAPPGGRHRER